MLEAFYVNKLKLLIFTWTHWVFACDWSTVPGQCLRHPVVQATTYLLYSCRPLNCCRTLSGLISKFRPLGFSAWISGSRGLSTHKAKLLSSINSEPKLKSECEHTCDTPSPYQASSVTPSFFQKWIQSTNSANSGSFIRSVIKLLGNLLCAWLCVCRRMQTQEPMRQIARTRSDGAM